MADLLSLIASGGRQQGGLIEKYATLEGLKARQEELGIARKHAEISLQDLMLRRDKAAREQRMQQMRTDIVSSSAQEAAALGLDQADTESFMKARAAAVGDIGLVQDINAAYKQPVEKNKPVSNIGQLVKDYQAATAAGNEEAADIIKTQIDQHNSEAELKKFKAQNEAEQRAFFAIGDVFNADFKPDKKGNPTVIPEGTPEVQDRYIELAKKHGDKKAKEMIQQEFKYEPHSWNPFKSPEFIKTQSEESGLYYDFTQ